MGSRTELAGARKHPDRPGHVVQNFQEEPWLPPRMHVTEKGLEGGLAAGGQPRERGQDICTRRR